jgi:hypothetical protein
MNARPTLLAAIATLVLGLAAFTAAGAAVACGQAGTLRRPRGCASLLSGSNRRTSTIRRG